MASPAVNPSSNCRSSKPSYTRLYPRQYERNHHYYADCDGSSQSESLWRRTQELVRNWSDSLWRHNGFHHHFLTNKRWRRLSARCYNQISGYTNWFSSIGRYRHNKNHKHKRYHYLLIGLLTVGCMPAYAEDDVYNTSAPESTATGNVTNQAVQFQNNGAPSRQQMGGYNGRAIACNGATMTFSPFWLASENKPYDPESYSRGWNYGAQLNFMVPLDRETVERCKSIAKRVEQKMRVDYELVRALKCAELMQKGFTLRPGSRVEHMCNDVVPIVSVITNQPLKIP